MKVISIFFSLFFFITYGFSQDTVIFVSGNKLAITTYYKDTTNNNTFIVKTLKGKYKSIHKEEIFSFVKSSGEENIVFEPFEDQNDEFTIENMKIYIKGEQTALTNSKTRLAFLSGFAIGMASPILLSSIGANYLLYAPVPIATTNFITGLTIPSEQSVLKKYPKQATNKFFMEGYRYTSKNKRLNSSIKGGLIGLGVGIISSIIISRISQ
ncbi:MAG TPA: hypothetical protein EYP69_01695 [Bacteroidales bacterium]|nr:hypothetical protein [Bacteroidales bacterium]